MNRAYSVFEIKAIDEDQRIIEGIATTPTPDRMGDILDPKGAEFTLPIPLLWQHKADQPVGNVIKAEVTAKGITVRAKFEQVAEPASLKEELDRAWAKVKAKLVRGFSVGFVGLESARIKDTFSEHFTKWEWVELSCVTIPMNSEATIQTVKHFDTSAAAPSGNGRNGVSIAIPAAVAAPASKRGTMTIKESITQFENTRAAKNARLDELIKKSNETGSTLNEAESEEFDTLEREVAEIDKHLTRLRAREKSLATTATAVTQQNTATSEAAAATRTGTIQVRSMAPKGIGPARMAIAMWHAKNNPLAAAELCAKHWPDSPELGITLKAIVEAADTSTSGWASQLVPAAQQMQQEFIDMYRDATIIGRIPGLRRVPFNVAVPLRTAAGTFQWVGEAAPKPVTSETFDRVTLTWAKAAAITVITKELAKFSSPSAEMLIRDSMRETLIRFLDAAFVSTAAAVSGVSPAGILNGISATSTTGTTAATFRTDMNTLLAKFATNKVPLDNLVLLMSSKQALALSLMVTDLGVPLFPTIARSGGSLAGIPVVISEAVGTKIIALNASDILLAEDPNITVSVSDQATIEMETTPAIGEQSPPSTQSVLKSMFQNNMLAILCEQFITWLRARTSGVEYINANAYVP